MNSQTDSNIYRSVIGLRRHETKSKMLRRLITVPLLCYFMAANAAAPATGLEGPLMFLWAIAHPIESIKALAKVPAERRRQEAYRLARAQCDAEEILLPQSIDIDSFIDEGAALRESLIYELLLKRNVRAIFVRPQATEDGQMLRYGFPDSQYVGGFLYPVSQGSQLPDVTQASAKYIKLELAREDEANCLPRSWTPAYTQDSYKRVPVLPKTCLAYSFTESPQTHHALSYKMTELISDQQFGVWSIVDLKTNSAIASLTTVDIPPRIISGSSSDCGSPYSVLAWRIKAGSTDQSRYSVKESVVVASPPFIDLITQKDSLPLIQADVVKTPFKSGEWEAATDSSALYARWEEAVDSAKRSGTGHYDGQGAGYRFSPDHRIDAGAHGRGRLLDWGQRNLIGIQLIETGTEFRTAITWDVSASEGGFIAFTSDWTRDAKPLVARYNAAGKIEWAIRIPGGSHNVGCGFGPRSAFETGTEIVLTQPSCNKKEGTEWRIRKTDIPFYKSAFTKVDRTYTSYRPLGKP